MQLCARMFFKLLFKVNCMKSQEDSSFNPTGYVFKGSN